MTTTTKYTAKIGGLALAEGMTLSEAIEASKRSRVCIDLYDCMCHSWRIVYGEHADHFKPASLGVLSYQEIEEWAEELVLHQWQPAGWRAANEFHRHAADAMAACIITLTGGGGLNSPSGMESARRLAKAVQSVRRWQEEGLANE